MRLGFHSNELKDASYKIAERIIDSAIKLGFDCGSTFYNAGSLFSDFAELVKWSNIIVVIGGDGTVLKVAEICAYNNVPILAINNGNLGFLTEVGINDVESALVKLKKSQYDLENRDMLETKFDGKAYIALNEVLVARRNRSSVCKLSAYCDGVYFDTYTGDGLMISTPTGSTGYSLSASGPVLSPKLNAFVLTPLCTHSFNSRAIVFGANEVLKIKIDGKDDMNCIHIDGRQISNNAVIGTEIEVKKSKYHATFIRFSESSFYSRLYSKLSDWNKGV